MSGGAPEGAAATAADRTRRLAERCLAELSTQLAAGDSQRLEAYLRAMGRFHHYSFGNIMLIISQNPEATRVAGFHTWRTLGRAVRKGERGIAIFAPMMLKSKEDNAPSDAGATTESESKPRLRFRVVYVFDVTQTEGDPLPALDRVTGDPGVMLERLEAAVRSSGITLVTAEGLGGADGLSEGGAITLRAGLSPAERFSVLAHEWAHEILHQSESPEQRPEKVVRETEAEAVAFVVSSAAGLAPGGSAADYIRLYRGDAETLAASLDRVQKAACRILDAVMGNEEPAASKEARTPEALAVHRAVHARRLERGR